MLDAVAVLNVTRLEEAMTVVFQYGSNMSMARLNGSARLAGDAQPIGIARTVLPHELSFTVWSKNNYCAAASIGPSDRGRSIYGVLYEIPDFLIARDSAKTQGRKSLDEIEGEGTNYVKESIALIMPDGAECSAITYVGKTVKTNVKTSLAYVQHILYGLEEHCMPSEYRRYLLSRIIENNSELRGELVLRSCRGS